MSRPSPFTDDAELQCSVDGCNRRWTQSYGSGRLCSKHDDEQRGRGTTERAQQPLPAMAPAARHWQDEVERDDERLPF